jgi:hypothetical protein
MTRRDDAKGFLLVDERGRVTVIGDELRERLRSRAGYYSLLPSEKTLLHFQKSGTAPTLEEFNDPIVLSGDIAGMGSTIEIINFINASQLSGNLVFISGDSRKSLYFKKGEVRSASSNRVEDRLGEILFRFGALSRDQLDNAIRQARKLRRPLGNFLLEEKLLTQQELYGFVMRQVEEIFYSILLIKEGDFYLTRFDVDSLPRPLSLNTQSLLMEGLRRMDEMAYFRQRIPQENVRFARTELAVAGEGTARERNVIEQLDEPRGLEELTFRSRLGEFETLKVLHHLMERGTVRILRDLPQGGGDGSPITGEMSNLVDTFNSVFRRIYQAVSKHGRQDALESGLETFLQFYGFVELFQDVRFDEHGALDKETLLANLQKNQIDNRLSFLSQALNELLFFEMFAAREWLERDEQQDLQKIINQLFIEIG